jgi:hypothetical protein
MTIASGTCPVTRVHRCIAGCLAAAQSMRTRKPADPPQDRQSAVPGGTTQRIGWPVTLAIMS